MITSDEHLRPAGYKIPICHPGRWHQAGCLGGIGAFAVKFRWVVIAVWLIAGFAVPKFLPSLSSVTQGNNSAFLPADAPSEQAAQLAAPFGSTNLIPVPVVAAVSQGTLTPADVSWLTGLQHDLGSVKTVVAVHDLGRSADQQAEQLQVLSNVGGGDETGVTNLVNDLRAQIAKASPPAGLQVHLAGQLAISVDQQTKSGSTGNQVEGLSVIFILVLLLLIFRSLLAPLITLIPAFLAVAVSGPLVAEAAHAGLKVSQLAQLMLIVLVLGAGTDYGLFLVFRVRENLREGADPKDAVRSAVTRVGETITVALSFFAALGLSVILFIKIGGDSGLTFILPFLMFIFLLALGEDYNILVMSRIREEAQHLPLRDAVSRAVGATGTTVTSAGLVLAGTFAVFALVGGRGSGGSQIRDVGVGLALGVLMDTFIVRTVLVPCTVILLGRWNWWPSALSRAGAQPGGSDGPGPDGPGGPGSPGGEGTEQDTESAAPRTR